MKILQRFIIQYNIHAIFAPIRNKFANFFTFCGYFQLNHKQKCTKYKKMM